MAVALNTIRTNAWDIVYTYLQTTNPISTNNIHTAMNDKLVSAEGYPQVIIASPEVTFSKVDASGQLTECGVSMTIEIYQTSNQNVKAMADEVTAKLQAGKYVFAGNRLVSMDIESLGNDDWTDGKKKIHRVSMSMGFRFVG